MIDIINFRFRILVEAKVKVHYNDFLNHASHLSEVEFKKIYSHPALLTISNLKCLQAAKSVSKITRLNIFDQYLHTVPDEYQIYFIQNGIRLGRDASCEIIFDNDEVSREHAKIKYLEIYGGNWVAIDCCSRNGTYVNNQRIRFIPHLLKDHDVIHLGKSVNLIFRTPEGLWKTISSHVRNISEAILR